MEQKIRLAVQKYNMYSDDDKIAVAFSGGADSAALLTFLAKNRKNVAAIHVNHMIRGKEADRDEEFCRDFCKKIGVPFFISRVNVPQYAENNGIGTEEAARILRYRELYRISKQISADRLATAHHANDNAETVLFNLIRGSGGAVGIPPVRDNYIIRPLILCKREEILDYCKKCGIAFVTDSTNSDTDYSRNYIRSEILPRLQTINPNAVSAIMRFSENSRRDSGYLDRLAMQLPDDMTRAELAELDDALLSRYIINFAKHKNIVIYNSHVRSIIQLIRCGNDFHTLDLAGNAQCVLDRSSVYFTHKNQVPAQVSGTLLAMGENIWQDGIIYISQTPEQNEKYKIIYKKSIHIQLNFDTIKGNLFARTRQGGDRYRINGVNRLLKKLMCEMDIPVMRRDVLPVIYDDEGIVWIPGLKPRDGADTNIAENKLSLTYYF